jgi:hypothetical protein
MDEQELIAIIEQAARDRRTTLDLSGKGITAISSAIKKLTNLQQLNLSINQIITIPKNEQQNRVEYWLKLIETYGGDSPVILIVVFPVVSIMALLVTGTIDRATLSRFFEGFWTAVPAIAGKKSEQLEKQENNELPTADEK